MTVIVQITIHRVIMLQLACGSWFSCIFFYFKLFSLSVQEYFTDQYVFEIPGGRGEVFFFTRHNSTILYDDQTTQANLKYSVITINSQY